MLKPMVVTLAAMGAAGWLGFPAVDQHADGANAGMQEKAQDFEWRGRIAAGKAIEIKGINGDVDARPASGDEVVVTATKRANGDDPESVRIEVVAHDDGVTICAVYPSKRGDQPNECAPGRRGRMNTHDNDVTVDFEIQVPKGVRFIGRTVNGDVRARNLNADIDLATVNGGIDASTSGRAAGRTVNGGIDIRMGRADWRGTVEFQTVNGSIRLVLPADLSAEVRAQTVNGDIDTEFPLTVEGRFGPRHVSGVIGSGGRTLELQTVNGSISLRKGG